MKILEDKCCNAKIRFKYYLFTTVCVVGVCFDLGTVTLARAGDSVPYDLWSHKITNDNVQEVSLTRTRNKPDLQVISVTWDTVRCGRETLGQKIPKLLNARARITVKNTGNGGWADKSLLSIYSWVENCCSKVQGDVSVGKIKWGKTRTVYATIDFSEVLATLWFVTDSENVVAEYNENNNQRKLTKRQFPKCPLYGTATH